MRSPPGTLSPPSGEYPPLRADARHPTTPSIENRRPTPLSDPVESRAAVARRLPESVSPFEAPLRDIHLLPYGAASLQAHADSTASRTRIPRLENPCKRAGNSLRTDPASVSRPTCTPAALPHPSQP